MLLLSFPKMTTKPHCISQITMRFMNMDPPFEVTVPVNGSLEYLNPFRGPSRCVPMKILMIITFLSLSHYRNVELENIVTPLAEKCLTNFTICTTFTPDTKRLLILPKWFLKKVWETCLYSVSYRQTRPEPVSRMSLPRPFLITFENNVCVNQSFPINYNIKPTPLLQESGKIL